MLTIWDNQAKKKSDDREIRLALLASGTVTPAQAFPELFAADGETAMDEDAPLEVTEYESPGADGANYDRVMAALAANRRITTREGSETSEEVTGTQTFPLEPEDPEWT